MSYTKMDIYWIDHHEASRRDALQGIINCPDKDLHELADTIKRLGPKQYLPIVEDMLESYNFCTQIS